MEILRDLMLRDQFKCKHLPCLVNIAPVPKISKKPNATDIVYEANIHEPSSLNLYLNELESVRGLDARGKKPERLVFYIQW